jgi:hypothetical protein
MSEIDALRTALLTLHRELLQLQRVEAERFGGRMSAAETLQAAAEDLRFSWLRTLSELISELDRARSDDDERQLGVSVERVAALLDPPDPDSAFGARYLSVLQTHPEAVLAHRDVTAALARLGDSPPRR